MSFVTRITVEVGGGGGTLSTESPLDIDRVSGHGTAIGHVRPFVHVCFHYLLNQMTFVLDILHVYES